MLPCMAYSPFVIKFHFKNLVKLICQPEKLVYSFVAAAAGDSGGIP